ncbi:MAG: hypothetical protein KAJ39_02180 [Gammaproteobacteria bacterium]|nr:hypothetical protein [Gammaproteobacteria bacterium]
MTHANVGTNGPHKITIEWTIDDTEKAVVNPIEVTGEPSVDKLTGVKPATETDMAQPELDDKLSDILPADTDDSKDTTVLSEIDKINKNDFTTTKFIPIEANLSFAETEDGRLSIKYAGSKINTTWEEVVKLEQSIVDPIPRGVTLLKENDLGPRRTTIIKFINKMRKNNIKPGDGLKLFKQIFNKPRSGTLDHKDADTDPDADFRSTGVASSVYPPISPSGQDFGNG